MTKAVLGVDVGTSSTKGVLVALDGTILASAVRQHEVDRPRVGQVEMDATIWWDEFQSIAAELGHTDAEIIAIGVSGMGPCALLTDKGDSPLRPAILYGVDTRATAQIARLAAELGEDVILERCGSALTSQAVGPKLAWVAENEPDTWARAERLYMPSSYLVQKLAGVYILDQHSASQCTPLYDAHSQEWIPEWAERIAPGLQLPPLVWPGEIVGTTEYPIGAIPAGIPVVAGTIDAWTESISVDATHPGDLMLMYGTTMFLIATVDTPITDRSMWGTTGAFPGTHNLAGGLATSGAITAWIRRLVGDVDFPTLLAEAEASPPGANGLIVLPYFAGERTPILDPDARGVVAGLTLSHTRGDIYRAALEGIALAVRHNIETMRAAGARIDRIIAVGGGTQGGLWTQIVSDVTGCEQLIPSVTIGASLGAAMLAAAAVAPVDIATWNPVIETVLPEPVARAAYDLIYPLYRRLYSSTSEVIHDLVRITADVREEQERILQ